LEPILEKLVGLGTTPISELTLAHVGQRVSVAGIVSTVKKIVTKAGNHEMAFVKLEDIASSIEVVVFPKIYARTMHLWVTDTVVKISGKLEEKEERLVILADEAAAVAQEP